MRLASLVMFVSDLNASIAFYNELLGTQVTIINDTAALLVAADGNQIYLREIGARFTFPRRTGASIHAVERGLR
jgi:catechol 2,3-dioxygenase-like lactoylglutathione lyase family enzyme